MEKVKIVNRTDFKTKDIQEIAEALLQGQGTPNFYLLCQTPQHDGLTITNLDKPAIIIVIHDLHQFAETYVHEVEHLRQHSQNFADEDFDSELITTDKHKTKEEVKPPLSSPILKDGVSRGAN